MGNFALWQFGRKARHERVVRRLVSHINSGDEQAAADCLAPDLVVTEVGLKKTVGRGGFLLRDREFRQENGNPQITIDTLDHHADDILVRMHHSGTHARSGGPTFWRVTFDGDAISQIEATQETGHKPPPHGLPNEAGTPETRPG